MTFFWNSIVNELTNIVIEEIIIQFLNNLKSKFPNSLTDVKTLQDVNNWHNSVEGAVEHDIAWISIHAQFDQKQCILNLVKEIKENYDVNCEE